MPPTANAGPVRAPKVERAIALVLAAAILALLAVAWRLDPDPRGLGTHHQLGLTPCGFRAAFGRPCLTCGMTTSFAHAGDGRFIAGARAQPVGLLLCVFLSAVFWGAAHVAATGSRLSAWALRGVNGRTLALAGLIAGGGWAYKLLTTPPSPGLLW
ncbi:MAG: DUF2752 domain-containing protein [Phycisphaerae bacterium]|nr:DUF2752 domain-containing protein [Phycisphaerae bacterium]